MLHIDEDEKELRISYSHYLLPTIFLSMPPLLLFHHGSSLLDGSIKTGELVGLLIGVFLPLLFAYFFIEWGSFRFCKQDGLFSWRWRNLIRRDSGQVPLSRVVRVRREGMESSDIPGWQNSYRLVVILDDDSVIGLTRGYSGMHDRKLDSIVNQLRDFLGHSVRMP